MAGKIPSPEALGVVTPQIPYRRFDTSPDTSGLVRGVNALSAGIDSAASSITQIAAQQKQQDNAVDLAKAEALKTKGFYDLTDSFKNDPNYATFAERANTQSSGVLQQAGELIRDPTMKQRWLADAETQRLTTVHGITGYGDTLATQAKVASLSQSLDETAKLASDPSVPETVRQKARADLQGTIDMGAHTGLLSPADAYKFQKTYVEGADNQLSVNHANLSLVQDPHAVLAGMGVPTADAGPELSQAMVAVAAGEFSPELGKATAAQLNDANYPADPKLAAAYLKDPSVAQRYMDAATRTLTQRYKGDMSAAVIAAAPGGGDVLAAKWVKSGHDESVLPGPVADYYKQVMTSFKPDMGMPNLPVVAAPHVDLANVDPGVLDRFAQLQSAFGKQMPVTSGYRDSAAAGTPGVNGAAIDVDVSKLSPDDMKRLVSDASALGFGGIGVEGDHLHLDTGPRRMWGPDHSPDSVPAWATDLQSQHVAGTITQVQPNFQPVDPRFAALSFDQRLAFYDKAKQQVDRGNVTLRAGLDVQVQNAPSAIANTGTYTGNVPDANAFVAAYGGVDGLQRWKAFDATLDVAHTTFSMRTMSQGQILDTVHNALPTSSGDDAALQADRFDAISKAAQATLAQRTADPAGYVRQHFPDVDTAWLGVGKDPQSFSNAVTLTAQAQQKLGMELSLLPKDMATNAAASFNNQTLSTEARIGAVTHLALAVQDPTQQAAIYQQLVKSGVPEYTQGAMAALERGDSIAAGNLFRAAVTDTSKLPGGGVLPNGVKDSDIKLKIQEQMLDRGKIGDVAYGLTDGTPENFHRAELDGTLIDRSVKLKLLDGTAGSVDDAIAKTAKELYGDVKVLSGNSGGSGVKALVPNGTDENQFRAGLTAMLPRVDDAILAHLAPMTGLGKTADSSSAVLKATAENYAGQVLADGYFTNSADGYVFINPKTGTAVPGDNGKPLLFSHDDVLGAGMAANARKAATSGWSGPANTGMGW